MSGFGVGMPSLARREPRPAAMMAYCMVGGCVRWLCLCLGVGGVVVLRMFRVGVACRGRVL